MRYLKYILFVWFAVFLVNTNAQSFSSGDSRNGTYKGVSVMNYKKYGADTNAYRICFLNDTIFVFTKFSYTWPHKKMEAFNYPRTTMGFGRLITPEGKKEWWGVLNISARTYFDDPRYTELMSRPNSLSEMVNRKPPRLSGSIVVQFKFLRKKMDVIPSKELSMHTESGLDSVRYKKIDNVPIDFTINKKNYDIKSLGYASDMNYVAQIKKNVDLQLIPIPEKVPANKKMGQLKKGEEVYLFASCAEYTFVVKYNAQKEVVKYGWIPRNFLYNLRKIEIKR